MIPLLEIQYLPPVSTLRSFFAEDELLIEQQEHYTKGSYRNRCYLAGSQGPVRLSIPLLKGKHQQQPIREVEMDLRQNWPIQHWRTLQSCYGKSPFFEFYRDELEEIYLNPPPLLFDWNLTLIKWLLEQLQWKGTIQFTQQFDAIPGSNIRDLRGKISPKNREIAEGKSYPQLFADRFGFIPGLSSIDLLFSTGPEAARYLV